jgi:hypothetical protein
MKIRTEQGVHFHNPATEPSAPDHVAGFVPWPTLQTPAAQRPTLKSRIALLEQQIEILRVRHAALLEQIALKSQ